MAYAMKKEQKPHILNVELETKNVYFQENYGHCVKAKKKLFDKDHVLLSLISCASL